MRSLPHELAAHLKKEDDGIAEQYGITGNSSRDRDSDSDSDSDGDSGNDDDVIPDPTLDSDEVEEDFIKDSNNISLNNINNISLASVSEKLTKIGEMSAKTYQARKREENSADRRQRGKGEKRHGKRKDAGEEETGGAYEDAIVRLEDRLRGEMSVRKLGVRTC
jgi:hypothetical protein